MKKEKDYIRKYFYKPLFEDVFLKALVNSRVTPNQLSSLGIVIGAISSVLLLTTRYPFVIVAGFLLIIRNGIDCLDGALATAKNMQSDFGHRLDSFGDKSCEILVVFCVLFGQIFYEPPDLFFILTVILVISGFVLRFFSLRLRKQMMKSSQHKIEKINKYFHQFKFVSRSVLWRLTIIAIAAILGEIMIGLLLYAILSILCGLKESIPTV